MRTPLSVAALLLTLASVRAQPLTVTPYGPSSGPIASGEVLPQGNHWRFAFTVSGAQSRVSVMNILGVTERCDPINFGSTCYLLTDFAFSQIHQTDQAGTYTWSHSFPGGPGGFSGHAYVQFAEITFDQNNDLIVRTSNGLHLAPI